MDPNPNTLKADLKAVAAFISHQGDVIETLTLQNDQYRGIVTFVARRTVDDWAREQLENALKAIPRPDGGTDDNDGGG